MLYVGMVSYSDHDDSTLAQIPTILPVSVVTKTGGVQKSLSMGENNHVRNSAHGSTMPVRQGKGTIELWYTTLYPLKLD